MSGNTTTSNASSCTCSTTEAQGEATYKKTGYLPSDNGLLGWFARQARKLTFAVLKNGRVPRHVAFIMDGNRRFATNHGLAKHAGHSFGLQKLMEALEWCMDLGVKEVTVYAFSIENFKRPEAEVSTLMQLAIEKFRQILGEEDWAVRNGVTVRVQGDVSLLPADLRSVIARASQQFHEAEQRMQVRAVLNVCLAYTGRDEITRAADALVGGVRKGLIDQSDISEALLNSCMYVDSAPDLLIRTSGEMRLSDFLLWQSCYCYFVSLDCMWPEMTFADLAECILRYQQHAPQVDRMAHDFSPHGALSPAASNFVEQFRNQHQMQLELML